MKVKSFTKSVVILAFMTLLGCSSGGDSEPAPVPTPPPAGSITISGVAAKGPLNGADVTVFAVKSDGTFDRTLGNIATGKTSSDGTGKFSINILKPPAGAVVIEVTGGTYTDEVSGIANVLLTAPIRAVVSAVADGDKIAVTPFTEMAYKKAEGIGTGNAGSIPVFTKSSIDDSNSSISKTFGIDNIVTTIPFDPTNAAAAATATASQKNYSAALGTFSQMTDDKILAGGVAMTAASLSIATDSLIKDLGAQVFVAGGINQTSLDSYNNASFTFNGGIKNQTGTTVPQITFTAGVLTISTTGALPAGSVNNVINGIHMKLTLPAGVTVASDALGEVSLGVMQPSSMAAVNSLVISKYTPATANAPGFVEIVITNVQPGFGIGEFMHINFLGFPAGLKSADFKVGLFAAGDGIFGGGAGGNSTAALAGITLSITDFVGL